MKKILIILTLIFLLTGCGSSKNKLIGEWYYIENEVVFTVNFKDSKKCEIFDDETKNVKKCTYSYTSKELTIKTDDEEIKTPYELKDNYLVLRGIKFYNSLDSAKENVKENSVKVPDVTGMNLQDASNILNESGLVIGIITESFNDDIEEGKVIETYPSAGKMVGKLFEVSIKVSKGVERLTIEDYTGMDYLEVKEKLESYGIIVKIEEKEEKSNNQNEIIGQNVEKDTVLKKGEKIILYIGK